MLNELEKIYPETKNQTIFQYFYKRRKDKKVELKYYEYSDKIHTYLIEKINILQIIEGRHIYQYMNHNFLKSFRIKIEIIR